MGLNTSRKKKVVWKVVRRVGESLYSGGLNCHHPKKIEYIPGKVTLPHEESALFAFDTLNSARIFLFPNTAGDLEIWRAEAVRPRKVKWLLGWLRGSVFLEFWRSKRRGRHKNRARAPEGTLVCDSLILLEKVE